MVRRWIAGDLMEWLCERTHFVTLHRPWLWVFPHCPFSTLSYRLDERWGTGYWQPVTVDELCDEWEMP